MDIPAVLFLESNRVWRTDPGGRTLDRMAGKTAPEDTHFPEDWIGSTTRAVNKGREHLTEEGTKFFVPYRPEAVVFESGKGMEIIAAFPPP